MRRPFRRQYTPPAIDSDRAVRDATQLLYMATDKAFDALTPEKLAYQFRLSSKNAEYLLTVARQRRAEHAVRD